MGDWDPADMVTRWAMERAEGHDMEYVEVFRRMVLVRDAESEGDDVEPDHDEVHDHP
jgi:hypothetical protein